MTKTSLNIVLCQHDSHTITMGFVTFNINLENFWTYRIWKTITKFKW